MEWLQETGTWVGLWYLRIAAYTMVAGMCWLVLLALFALVIYAVNYVVRPSREEWESWHGHGYGSCWPRTLNHVPERLQNLLDSLSFYTSDDVVDMTDYWTNMVLTGWLFWCLFVPAVWPLYLVFMLPLKAVRSIVQHKLQRSRRAARLRAEVSEASAVNSTADQQQLAA